MRLPKHPTLLRRQIDSRLKQLAAQRPVLAATLAQVARRCGNPTCHCLRDGKLHRASILVSRRQGKSRSVYVPKDLLKDVESWIEEYRRLKRLLQEINLLTLELIRGHVRHRRRKRGRP